MSSSDWATLMGAMYGDEERLSYPEQFHEEHPLIRQTGMDPETASRVRDLLAKKGWIEYDRTGPDAAKSFSLTTEGFEVAHERELRERQENLLERQTTIDEKSVHVYSLLVMAVGLQALTTAITAPSPYRIGLGLLVLVLFTALVLVSR